MPKPVDRLEQDIQDTLARIAAIAGPPPKMSERAIERGAGVPQGFLTKLRNGKNRHPNAVESIAALRRFLVEKGVLTKEPEKPGKISKGLVAAAVKLVGIVKRDGVEIPEEFALDFCDVKSADELLTIDRKIATETAFGNIEPKLSDALKGWSTELRQVLQLQDEHRAREELFNLVPMTADQAEEFWKLQEAKGIRPLAPGEAAKPPERPAEVTP